MFDSSSSGSEVWERIVDLIIDPIILLVFSAGFLVFVWGIFQFIVNLGKSETKMTEGKQHMLYGLLGMFIMVSVWGIIFLIQDTFGFDTTNPMNSGSSRFQNDDPILPDFGFE